MNTESGRIIKQLSQDGVSSDSSVNLLYDENGVIVSYFNLDSLSNEVWSIELFYQHIESSFKFLLEKYFLRGEIMPSHHDYISEDLHLTVFQQKYSFPKAIKGFTASLTKLGLTKRNILIITETNQVYSLDRNMISTRRALSPEARTKALNEETFISPLLPPYATKLPFNPLNFLTLNQTVRKSSKRSITLSKSKCLFLSFILLRVWASLYLEYVSFGNSPPSSML